MNLLSRFKRIDTYFIRLLILNELRHVICKIRWQAMKSNLKYFEGDTENISSETLNHNLSAFKRSVVFGMHNRMTRILYPLSSLIINKKNAKILIIGPRTEDDIFLAKALGFDSAEGLDLFSYSKHIKLGDMHQLNYPNEFFDAIVCGWVLAYSKHPDVALHEIKSKTKESGFIAIGWQWVEDEDLGKGGFDFVNKASDYQKILGNECSLCFESNPSLSESSDKAVIFQKTSVSVYI